MRILSEESYFEFISYAYVDKLFFRIRSILGLFMLLISINIIVGCKHPSSKSDSNDIISITIDIQKDKNSFPLSEITEKIDIIELETNELSFINKEIQSVHILGDFLIVKDASMCVLVFDMQGNYIRRIGKQGQGPGELFGVLYIQTDPKENTIWFWMFNKVAIFDINGNLVHEFIRNELISYSDYYYYSNGSIFIIQMRDEKNEKNNFNKEISFLIRNYSNGNYSDNLLDSLPILKYNSEQTDIFKTIFKHQNQIYMNYSICCNDEYNYLYVVKNNKFAPFARFLLKSPMRGLVVTERFVVVTHGNILFNKTQTPKTITPDMMPTLRNQSAEQDFSYYVYDYKTGKNLNSFHGFIDDIQHTKEIIPINYIDGCDMFFYTVKGEWSEEFKSELNPTLYIGTFKK